MSCFSSDRTCTESIDQSCWGLATSRTSIHWGSILNSICVDNNDRVVKFFSLKESIIFSFVLWSLLLELSCSWLLMYNEVWCFWLHLKQVQLGKSASRWPYLRQLKPNFFKLIIFLRFLSLFLLQDFSWLTVLMHLYGEFPLFVFTNRSD